jgi:uncharacterized protein (DUF2461 family)
MITPTSTTGFGSAATEFFEDLEDQNTREFWLSHKDVFEREVREPMAPCWTLSLRSTSRSRSSE